MKSENSKEVKQKMKRGTLSILILFGMGLFVVSIMPVATNNDVIPLDKFNTDMHQIISDPGNQYCPMATYNAKRPPTPISGERDVEKAALEEAVRNLPTQYASPAAHPRKLNSDGRNHHDGLLKWLEWLGLATIE